MKIFYFLFLLTGVSLLGQTYYSGNVYGGGGIDAPYKAAKDSNGNVYTAGLYQTTMTVGSTTITTSGGNADAFLAKHDANGNQVWVKSFGGNLDDSAFDVAIDSNDNIYLIGYFQGAGSNSFDANPANTDDDGVPSTPNADEYWLSQIAQIASRDGFIIKLDSNGDFVWARQISNPIGGAANEDITAIELDTNGDLYMVGSFLLADFDPDPTATNTIYADNGNTSNSDGFLLKINSSGQFQWVKTFIGTGGITKINDLALDASNNVYITGQFAGSVDLNPDASATANFTSAGSNDSFLAKYDSGGNYLWAHSFGSAGADISNIVKVLSSGVYIGGYFSGLTDFDPTTATNNFTPSGPTDGFVSKFMQDGTYQFTYVLGGDSTSAGEQVQDIEEMNGYVLVSGDFLGTADFDNGSGTASATANNGDVFVVKINSTGNYVEHLILGDDGIEDFGKLEILNGNKVFLYGAFRSAIIDLNPFTGFENFTNVNSRDVFVSVISEAFLSAQDIKMPSKDFSVYPNPASDLLYIKSKEKVSGYEIFSMEGRMVMKGEVKNNKVQVSQLQTGVYIVKLKVGESWISHQLIKK